MAVLRLKPNGTFDRTFGSRGKRLVNPGRFGGRAYAVVRQPNGKLILGGLAYEDEFMHGSALALARLTARGARDRSFGRDGIVPTRPTFEGQSLGGGWIRALAFQGRKLLAAGEIGSALGLARYRLR